MAKRAKWMRNGSQTIHEGLALFVMGDICKELKVTLKNQKILYDEKNKKWYITDFYIPEKKLIIEIDGSSHDSDSQIVYDDRRTAFIESLGMKVVRFRNKELESLDFRAKVLNLIRSTSIDPPKNEVSMVDQSVKKRIAFRDMKAVKLTHEELEDMTSAFLKSGGKVQHIPGSY
uniref:DUF559 domain-containing protein n=1 Tax=viral metagenome TaxID=1070528 RepID=A0A6H1ZIC6_9ZZZZ